MNRILTAAVLLPLLWLLIKRAPQWAFFAVAGATIAIATWECYRLLEHRGSRPFKWIGMVTCVLLVWAFLEFSPRVEVGVPLLMVTVLTLLAAIWVREDPPSMLEASVSTLFPVIFVGFLLGHAVRLKTLPGEDGEDLLMLLFACVIAADTAAYYVGTYAGRHRMAGRLSPKKTWEGAAGGAVASVAAALVAHLWFYQRLPLAHALIIGLLLACAGSLSDLAESMVKRAAGRKDSSSLLPGHGGILDRTDSVLFSAPLLYYYYDFFLRGSS